jgi:competence protein ComEA
MRRTSFKAIRLLTVAALCAAVLTAGAGDALAVPPAKDEGGSKSTSPIDLNKASENQLMEIPGIGPALAKRIVEFRDENGDFQRVEDLLKIRGIGEKSFQKIRPHVTVKRKK